MAPAFLYEEGGREVARSSAPVLPQYYGSTLIDNAASWRGTSCWQDLRSLFTEELVWSKALLALLYGKHLSFDVSLFRTLLLLPLIGGWHISRSALHYSAWTLMLRFLRIHVHDNCFHTSPNASNGTEDVIIKRSECMHTDRVKQVLSTGGLL